MNCRPDKPGQVVKFHTPLPDENPEQLYVVIELIKDVEQPRVRIKALGTGLSFPPITLVYLQDIEVVKLDTTELIGHEVTINKSDDSQARGKVINVVEEKILLDLNVGTKGVETNVWVTILDDKGAQHVGSLFVD